MFGRLFSPIGGSDARRLVSTSSFLPRRRRATATTHYRHQKPFHLLSLEKNFIGRRIGLERRHLAFAVSPRGGGRGLDEGVDRGTRDDDDPMSRESVRDDNHRFITYMTDIEGDREYLTRYVKQSRVLCFRDVTPTSLLPYDHCLDFINPVDMLVFGGDIWDQGGRDLYVIRQLLDLKQRYPNRVHLVLGNRDINKMRLVAELGSSDDNMQSTLLVSWRALLRLSCSCL